MDRRSNNSISLRALDTAKSHVFSLALTIICLFGYENYEDFYDFNFGKRIKMEKIQKVISQMEKHDFNPDLVLLLESMLSQNPDERPNLQVVLSKLKNIRNPD